MDIMTYVLLLCMKE